jgi:hypothetical protein
MTMKSGVRPWLRNLWIAIILIAAIAVLGHWSWVAYHKSHLRFLLDEAAWHQTEAAFCLSMRDSGASYPADDRNKQWNKHIGFVSSESGLIGWFLEAQEGVGGWEQEAHQHSSLADALRSVAETWK